jgi:hypothetical protein
MYGAGVDDSGSEYWLCTIPIAIANIAKIIAAAKKMFASLLLLRFCIFKLSI